MIEFLLWYVVLPYIIMFVLYALNFLPTGRTMGEFGGYNITPKIVLACAPVTLWLLMWETIFMFCVMILVIVGIIE